MQNENKKLAIFDIDGTIATKGVVPEQVLEGMRNLQKLGYLTTVCTGRGYSRMKHALAEKFEEIVSDDAFISLEGGSKVVRKNGEVVYADYFKEQELEHIIDFIELNEGIIFCVWFIDSDPTRNYQIWCKNENQIREIKEKRGEYSDVFHCSKAELLMKFKEQPISSITCRLESHIKVENLKLHFTRSEIDVIFMEGAMDFIRNISDKAKSIKKMEEFLGIPPERMIVAGNAINDVEMLNISAGLRILVGTDENSDNVLEHLDDKHNIVRLDSPEHLGDFLQNLKD